MTIDEPTPTQARPVIVACLKLAELRSSIDPLSGALIADPKSAAASLADEAGLELALRLAESFGGTVVAVSACPPSEPCDAMLRAALTAGAARAVRVDIPGDSPSDLVGIALAAAASLVGADVVCCGDASVDRGSGSVPAFIAGELGVAQALGLVALDVSKDDDGTVTVLGERRLDRGRRERLFVRPPCVISVEAGTARLRRGPLERLLSQRSAAVEVLNAEIPGRIADGRRAVLVGVEPFRPRARVVPPPPGTDARDRIAVLTGAFSERTPARTLVVDAEVAADELLRALAAWGELPDGLSDRLMAGADGVTAAASSDVPESIVPNPAKNVSEEKP